MSYKTQLKIGNKSYIISSDSPVQVNFKGQDYGYSKEEDDNGFTKGSNDAFYNTKYPSPKEGKKMLSSNIYDDEEESTGYSQSKNQAFNPFYHNGKVFSNCRFKAPINFNFTFN